MRFGTKVWNQLDGSKYRSDWYEDIMYSRNATAHTATAPTMARISFHGRRSSTNGPMNSSQVNAMRGCANRHNPPVSTATAIHRAIPCRAAIASNSRSVATIQNGSSEVASP